MNENNRIKFVVCVWF